MNIEQERLRYAVLNTEVVRGPQQSLYTFGTTKIHYYMVTEPAYSDLIKSGSQETIIREGTVTAERPRLVTPYYLMHLEGFSAEAGSFLEALRAEYGANLAALFYTYRNEPGELSIVAESPPAVIDKLKADIGRRGDKMATIIRGVDELWDVSLLKFVFELTSRSAGDNLEQMGKRGMLSRDADGIPRDARLSIEELFSRAARGECDRAELHRELERWGLFEQYEDRFLNLFRST